MFSVYIVKWIKNVISVSSLPLKSLVMLKFRNTWSCIQWGLVLFVCVLIFCIDLQKKKGNQLGQIWGKQKVLFSVDNFIFYVDVEVWKAL